MGFSGRNIRAISFAMVVVAVGVLAGPQRAACDQGGELVIKAGSSKCIAPQAFGGCGVGRQLVQPSSVVVSPDAKFVYVAYSNGIATFVRNIYTGVLAPHSMTDGCFSSDGTGPCEPLPWVAAMRAMAMDPEGKHLYVLAGNGLFRFNRNETTGLLTFVASNCFGFNGMNTCLTTEPQLMNPTEITVSPDGRAVFVIDPSPYNALLTFSRDPATGNLTSGHCYNDTGSPTCIAIRMTGSLKRVAFSPPYGGVSQHVYLLTDSSLSIFDRHSTTQQLTQKPGVTGCINSYGEMLSNCAPPARVISDARDLAISPDGATLYVASGSTAVPGIAVFNRSADGVLSQKTGTAGCITASGYDDGFMATCTQGMALMYIKRLLSSVDGRNIYVAGGTADYPGGAYVTTLRRNTVSGSSLGILSQASDGSECYSLSDSYSCTQEALLESMTSAGMAMSPDGANVYISNSSYQPASSGTGPQGLILAFDRPQEATPTPTPTPTPTNTPSPTFTPTPSAGDVFTVAAPRFIVKPGALTKNRSAMFAFHSSTAGASYWCSLDNSPFRACRWPVRYVALRMGQHTFQVKAVRRGSSSSITSYSWTIKN